MYNFEHDDVENSYYIEEEAFTEDDFESALSWLKAMPLERQLDFHVIDYREIKE